MAVVIVKKKKRAQSGSLHNVVSSHCDVQDGGRSIMMTSDGFGSGSPTPFHIFTHFLLILKMEGGKSCNAS